MQNSGIRNGLFFLLAVFLFVAGFFVKQKLNQKRLIRAEEKAALNLSEAEFLYDRENFPDAALKYLDAVGYFSKIQNFEKISYCYNCAGLCFRKTGNYGLALENFTKALSFSEKIKNEKERLIKQASASYNIAVVFDYLKFYKKALSFYRKAQQNYAKLNMTDDYNYSKIDIAIVYRKLNQFEKALKLQKSAYSYFKTKKNYYNLCVAANNLAYSFLKKGDFENSEKFHKEALSIAKKHGFNDMLPYIYSGMGELYYSLKDYEKSLYYQKLALKLAGKKDFDLKEYIFKAFSKLYLAIGNKKQAAFYLKGYNDLIARRYNSGIFEKIEEIIRFMEKERHKQKLAVLEKEKRIRKIMKYLFLVAFLAGFVAVSFLFYRYWEKKKINAYLNMLAKKDTLTELANRRDMMERIEREVLRFQRNRKIFSIAISDIDDFKKVNDKYGHGAGDIVLKKVAEIFRENVRKTDIVARWGGEEFLFLFPETDLSTAKTIVEKLRKLIEGLSFDYGGEKFQITTTFGLCVFDGTKKAAEVIELADKSLYLGKRNGKNRVECCRKNC